MPTTISRFSTPVSEVERRLRAAGDAMKKATAADGSVDLVKAKALTGHDTQASLLLNQLRPNQEQTKLTAEQAKFEFTELQKAVGLSRVYDTNADGVLASTELGRDPLMDSTHRLLAKATAPGDARLADYAPSATTVSLKARQDAEAQISSKAEFHAATKEGAEALKWAIREALVSGWDLKEPQAWDALNFSETSWQASIPLSFFDKYREGRGHLSDKELVKYFGCSLSEYTAKTRERVNARLLMDYQQGYLTGADLG